MSEVVVMETPNDGRMSRGKKVTHYSEAKSWEVDVTGQQCSFCSLDLIKSIKSGIDAKIANNVGIESTMDGRKSNAAVAELNSDGSIIEEFCSKQWTQGPGVYASFRANQSTGGCEIPMEGHSCDDVKGSGYVKTNKPPGTYYFGIKTWGEDEDEPSYPSPTAAIHEGRIVYPNILGVPIPQLELWQWGVIGTTLVVGIGGGYYISQEWL